MKISGLSLAEYAVFQDSQWRNVPVKVRVTSMEFSFHGLRASGEVALANQDNEIDRLKLAYKRLSEMYLEFGVGPVEVRKMAIKSIQGSSLEALKDGAAIAKIIEKAGFDI